MGVSYTNIENDLTSACGGIRLNSTGTGVELGELDWGDAVKIKSQIIKSTLVHS
jgi:hypothetical protein